MEILAHRGFWQEVKDKNSLISIQKAFRRGYGIETDLRDYHGRLVISHNIADEKSPDAEEMFKMYQELNCNSTLALNIKADGIQVLIEPLLKKYKIESYFLFDMSIPELVVNEQRKLKFYTRHSDIENECVMYQHAYGVWLDSFYNEKWLTHSIIDKHINSGKKVCIVSPELHGYTYETLWGVLKEKGYHNNDLVSLCTDVPDMAKEFFNE